MPLGQSPSLMTRLVQYLMLKSIVDLLFVAILALSFYYRTFDPHLRGWLDEASPRGVAGWAVSNTDADRPVEVQLYIDGRFIQSGLADFPRPDLKAAGITRDERHGFYFYLPPLVPGEHEADAYAVYPSDEGQRRTLRMLGNPLRFSIDAFPLESFYRGWLDVANPVSVSGWVANAESINEHVAVQLYIDDRFVEQRLADQPRPDLTAAGVPGDGKHGFFFFTPPLVPGEHEARVYAVQESVTEPGRTLRLVGRPRRFGSVQAPPAHPTLQPGEAEP